MLNEVHLSHSENNDNLRDATVIIQLKFVFTALHVLISILFLRCSKTFSRFPARAARRNDVLPSDCK